MSSPDTATQLAASDPSSLSPPVRVKKKKKVQPERALQEETLTDDNGPEGMNLDEIVPTNVPLFSDDGPPGISDMDTEPTTNVVANLTGGITRTSVGGLTMANTPHLDPYQKEQLRLLSESGRLEDYLRRAISPQYVAETSATTPVPASSADLMPPPKPVLKIPVIVLEGNHSPVKKTSLVDTCTGRPR